MLRQSIQNFIRFGLVCAVIGIAPLANGETLSYQAYTAPEGTHYIALGLQAPAQPAQQPPEVVFLIDTSASQMGQTRRDTLEAIVSTINQLPNGSKIQILAMDVETEPLTTQFAVKGSPEVESALRTLYNRVPLGATDFGKGLKAARTAFENSTADARRSVLYFGSGRSMAKPLTPSVFEKEVQNFVEQQIPLTMCAVGFQNNLGFTAAFANRTGGNLIDLSLTAQMENSLDWKEKTVELDMSKVDWKKIGKQIADSTTATVVWVDPASVQIPEGVDVYPVQMQPIRSDRATILVGSTDGEALPTFDLALTGKTAEGKVSLPFQLSVAEQKSGDNYLRTVVELAARDGGATMPIVGWDSMLQIQEMFIANIENQITQADAAMTSGNLREAQVMLDEALRADPSNKIARNMYSAVDEQMEELPNVFAQNREPATAAPALIETTIRERSLASQKIQNEVRDAITKASKQIDGRYPNFDVAVQGLKMTQQMVRSNTVLSPAERESFLDRLGNVIRQVEHERYAQEYRSVMEDTNRARQQALVESARAMNENQEKTIQIFARFIALMNVEEYGAAIPVGDEAVEMMPDDPAPYVARRMAQMAKYITEYEKLRHDRHIGFLETFMDAERSFVPVPMEPPFTYIDRDKWKLLSEYRKEKYSTITLADPDETVKTIKTILESRDIRLNIDDTATFGDLFAIIKAELRRLKMPDIHIELDKKALEEAGDIRTETLVAPEGFAHPRMRLRSALTRLLSPHDLTYIIRDESLLITTIDESRRPANMIIKVYPIADIYMLQQSSMMGGGGMMGGMGGGMYGGMGGGGYGGMGGGGYGGGRGSMGSSWSVPEEITRSTAAQTKQLMEDAKSAEDCNIFWTDHFAQENINHERIRNVVRQFSREMQTKKENADQVIALIEAAILSENAQPWMYEALTLSLYIKGAPKAKILRAALSAADFCQDPVDLLNVGFVMRTELDLEEYAFPLYQQALENLPPKRELYAATLRLAENLFNRFNDEESLRWIGLAILSQEWDGVRGEKLVQDAGDALAMLENRLKRQQRSEEAQQLALDIREAKLRDCVVTVRWTGDAGIDLMVLEPSNSLCWFNNPRSASGGLLKTAPTRNPARISNQSSLREVSYIVPKGFNGIYSLILYKSWGELANNLVSVTVEKGIVPGEGGSKEVAVPMEPKGVLIDFVVQSGRRTESVSEAELTAMADAQKSPDQQITSRNAALWRLVDDSILGQTTDETTAAPAPTPTSTPTPTTPAAAAAIGSALVSNPNITDYLFGARYVGYAPVIETFDAGVTLAIQQPVAVTPDRRYVLMNLNPEFNTLISVPTYSP